jgi:hypothetical protein
LGKHRVLSVTCLVACLVVGPWADAVASERRPSPVENGLATPALPIRDAAMAIASAQPLASPQSVAVGTERNTMVALGASALVSFGLAYGAYGATSTCKGRNGESTGACDRKVVIGAAVLGAGLSTFIIWALSRD